MFVFWLIICSIMLCYCYCDCHCFIAMCVVSAEWVEKLLLRGRRRDRTRTCHDLLCHETFRWRTPCENTSCSAHWRSWDLIQEFPRRDTKPKKRLQENRAIPCVLLSLMCIIALFSWSLLLGLESLLGNLGIWYVAWSQVKQSWRQTYVEFESGVWFDYLWH